jgi:hypothetical protein
MILYTVRSRTSCLTAIFVLFALATPALCKNTAPSDVPEFERASEAAKNGKYVECYNGICVIADRGHPQAQSILGHMYEDGVGVEKNISKAIKYYEQAASKGFPDAECRLGHIYYRGQAVPRDTKKACKWLTRAANHDMAEAQNTLGHMYLIGDGVKKDLQLASQWLHKAAANGIKEAEQAIVNLPAVKPITQETGAGRAFEEGMGGIEYAWEGYGGLVQQLRQATGTN